MPINPIDLIKSVGVEVGKSDFINNLIKELENKLKNMEEGQQITIDRFEGEYAVCENRQTNEMINIKKEDLPKNVKEGTILKFENNKYIIDEKEQENVEQRIKQKMDKLWN
jgi:maltodextrin utilization protein YvdJ